MTPVWLRITIVLASVVLCLVCCADAQTPAPNSPTHFDVVSIRPNRSGDLAVHADTRRPDGIAFTNYTLRGILLYAFDVQDFRPAGGPTWLDRDRFDVATKSDHAMTDADKRGRSGASRSLASNSSQCGRPWMSSLSIASSNRARIEEAAFHFVPSRAQPCLRGHVPDPGIGHWEL
jgi:hypothetical protein